MDSTPIMRESLHNTAYEANITKRAFKIQSITSEIINHAVSYSKNGCFSYTYPRCVHIHDMLSEIIANLKVKFPDCDVYYKTATEHEYDGIVINWS